MRIYDSSPVARAERLRRVRLMAGLKRGDFAHLAGVSPTTVSYWENVTHSGLTEDGAAKTVEAVAKAGILCSTTWLLNGEGEPPHLLHEEQSKLTESNLTGLTSEPLLEIELFKKYQGAVVVQVRDEAMSPVLLPHDYIGGIWQAVGDIMLSDEDTYIVAIAGELQARKVKPSQHPGLYDVHAICYSPQAAYSLTLKNIMLDKIARVIRVWR